MPEIRNKFNPTKTELQTGCQGELHPEAEIGIQFFNQGKYWTAHEHLEDAWKDEKSAVRELYRGILQAGVVYHHIRRKNYRGALKMLQRCQVWLSPWPNHCRSVNVGKLKADIETAGNMVYQLGPDKLDEFDPTMYKEIERISK